MSDEERQGSDPQEAETPALEEAQGSDPAPAEEAPQEEALAEDAATEAPEEEPAAAEAEAPAAEEPAPAEKPKAGDLPPGAELDPIQLEPERELSAEERARLEAEEEERARLEAEATADSGEEEPLVREGPRVQLSAERIVQSTGKRKSSIARVIVTAGGGEFSVNGRKLDDYFPRSHLQNVARQPLVASGYDGSLDVKVRVHGGGISGQAGAVRHGVARALTEIDPELRGELKRRGLLTRDARIKERRKAGLKKARKRPQFSKR
jgi:small subunit ribosomal protein S9